MGEVLMRSLHVVMIVILAMPQFSGSISTPSSRACGRFDSGLSQHGHASTEIVPKPRLCREMQMPCVVTAVSTLRELRGGGAPPMPQGWEEFFDEEYQIPYFYHAATGETVWERPLQGPPPGVPGVPAAAAPAAGPAIGVASGFTKGLIVF